MLRREAAFTLIELIMVIVILGILAAIAIPKFFNLDTDAKKAAEKGVVGGVRAGIATFFAKQKASSTPPDFPASLDGTYTGACTAAKACFNAVLQLEGITDSSWNKTGANTYTGPEGTTTYTYTSSTGEFK